MRTRHMIVAAAMTIASVGTVGTMEVTGQVEAAGRCAQYEHLLRQYPWSVSKMSSIMYRESGCLAGVVNVRGGDTGLLQIHPINFPWLSGKFGVPVRGMRAWLKVPANNVKAGYALCKFWQRAGKGCYHPWVVR